MIMTSRKSGARRFEGHEDHWIALVRFAGFPGCAAHDDANRQFGCRAPVENHLRPRTRYWSPSRLIVVCRPAGSEVAGPGSLMEKQDRISPLSSGSSHRSRCSASRKVEEFHVAAIGGIAVEHLGQHGMRRVLGQRGILEVGQPRPG